MTQFLFGMILASSLFASGIGNGLATTVPYWSKYTLTAIANGVNGCANANGCWQVNGVLGANKTAGLTQDVTLFQLPAGAFLGGPPRLKTATAFTGTTTLTATLGTATLNTFFVSAVYDLKAAVSVTNFAPASGLSVGLGSSTTAAVNVVLGLIATIQNIDQIVTGSSVDIWVQVATLP